jgi:predicted 3-demethylubiquinone-9 3-methyltransferase (glyoxalase superfamily)
MSTITPFLWFDDNAEEAMNFYVEVFGDAKVGEMTRYGDAGPGPAGAVMSATFELRGQQFMALNGGPGFPFTEAISFFVPCETQEEVDDLWAKLTAGGEESRCGWLKDRYGLSWQIIPNALPELLNDPDPVKSQRVMQAMLQMGKIDIAGLRRAYEDEPAA